VFYYGNWGVFGGEQSLQFGTGSLICGLVCASAALGGCSSNTSSGTTGGNGTIVVPLAG
ncbi:uncharacterized protein METZ01_LOCUS375223, partial [marine metagenome]